MNAKNSSLDANLVTAVNGTDDREAHSKRWIAVLVQVRSEKAVGKQLTKLGIENYVPTQTEIHQWSDRKKKVERIVIPSIVFIHADKESEKQFRYISLIYKAITYPGQYTAATIPDHQIERLQYMLRHAESMVKMKDRIFQVGETVHIARGPLKGLEGELCQVDSDKPMVAIRIECLGYACVNISKTDLE